MKTLKQIQTNPNRMITHPEKIIWSQPLIQKKHLITYLECAAPFMLPFLSNRALTTIRFPHGVPGASFFQKNCPDYAPEFIQTVEEDGRRSIICNDVETLLWLGNQLAIEYHIPFQKINSERPVEIVFDLDPPDRSSFALAIQAAEAMKEIFDRLSIISFPKLSGSRGIQIHLPIARLNLSYSDTRLFTASIAQILVKKFPDKFTIERLKKNRGGRLYIDYVQHAEGKTLICPYSPRGKEGATIAAPLYWQEVNASLKIENYSLSVVLDRLVKGIDPMKGYDEQENPFLVPIINKLKRLEASAK
ncbi:non-homologous end-joining DNA ligase [Sporolactobacillus kofuensis]|uniref:Non-homologous end-joining DNA ligase n=1 Tax=Sporolactobacillus kofuensis TaxID=269672 RepID=A0ABW1W9P4_9BACL|nr:non-homologous end-joining DNA ligase [Sporolactobacillus kofuensis]MCO7175998.1 non-homologous end-joining DNA ligase [Sporolactobacillus kofuensis]